MTASLDGLSLGSLTLSPAFNAGKTAYTASTTNASNTLTATAHTGATIEVKVNGEAAENGRAIVWNDGENDVVIKVSDATGFQIYSVKVTKS